MISDLIKMVKMIFHPSPCQFCERSAIKDTDEVLKECDRLQKENGWTDEEKDREIYRRICMNGEIHASNILKVAFGK